MKSDGRKEYKITPKRVRAKFHAETRAFARIAMRQMVKWLYRNGFQIIYEDYVLDHQDDPYKILSNFRNWEENKIREREWARRSR